MNYKVYDNVLDNKTLTDLKSVVFDEAFNWHWIHSQTRYNDSFYFGHLLYSEGMPMSNEFSKFIPILNSLPTTNRVLLNLRLNLLTNMYGHGWCKKHRDEFMGDRWLHNTAIFYFNTCNGKTVLYGESGEEDPIEIDTVENRLLVFNSKIYHNVIPQTDADRRIVLNINYI